MSRTLRCGRRPDNIREQGERVGVVRGGGAASKQGIEGRVKVRRCGNIKERLNHDSFYHLSPGYQRIARNSSGRGGRHSMRNRTESV